MTIRAALAATLLLAASAMGAEPVSAQNMSGTWEVQSRGRRGSVTQTLENSFPTVDAFQDACGRDADGNCGFDAFVAKLTPDGSES